MDRQLAFKLISGPIPFENTTTLEPQGDGTLITYKAQGEFGGFFKIAEGLVGKQAEKQFETSNAALKLLAEAGSD